MAGRVDYRDGSSGPSNEEATAAPAPQTDDLDRLLADFDASTTRQTPEPDTLTSSAELDALANGGIDASHQRAPQNHQHTTPNQQLVDRVNDIEMQHVIEKAGRDLKATVAEVRGELDSSVYNDEFVQTWVDNQARQNMALQHVWLNRENDPQAYRGAVASLQRQFYKTFRSAPDHDLTEDRHAVVAAMRGASSRVPADPPPNWGRQSNEQFRKEVRDKYGFDPI